MQAIGRWRGAGREARDRSPHLFQDEDLLAGLRQEDCGRKPAHPRSWWELEDGDQSEREREERGGGTGSMKKK